MTIDHTAEGGDDFEPIDQIISFQSGETFKTIQLHIINSEDNAPGEDFFVQLYDAKCGAPLIGKDTKTVVTMIEESK